MAIAKNRIVAPNRILAIKFSSIGDIVLTTSPLRTLSHIFPSAKIDFLTLNNFAPILEGSKIIHKIIQFDKNTGFKGLIKTGKWINSSDYDLLIDFHNSLRSKIIRSIISNIPKRYLKKPRWKRFILFRFRKNLFSSDFSQLKLLHQPIAEYMDHKKYPLPELSISINERKDAKRLLRVKGVNKQFIVIVPGAAWPQKSWIVKNYHRLLTDIKKRINVNFVILGGENDKICNGLTKCDADYINLQGGTSLRESMSIIANSKFVIGSDTGLVHAAEALGKRVVMILGPTSRETGAGVNRTDSVIVEDSNIWCRPCSQSGKRKCYRDEQYCITNITPQIVFNKMVKGGLL